MFDKFSDRHIGVTNPEDLKAMLAVIGVKSVDELIAQVLSLIHIFDERAVVGHHDNLALHVVAHLQVGIQRLPRVRSELLQTQWRAIRTKHFIMNWKTHESNISFHKNKQVDDG